MSDSLADAIRKDVLAGNLPELNPGDKARYEAEEAERQEAAQQAKEAQMKRMVEIALENAKQEGKL